MPDWMNIDGDQPAPPRQAPAVAPEPARRPRIGVAAMVVVGVAAIALAVAVPTLRQMTQGAEPAPPPASSSTPGPAAPPPRPTIAPSSSATTAPSSTASPVPSASGRQLAGQELADTWLRDYLTRPDRDDTAWTDKIADLTTPELMDELEQRGPDLVGLTRLQGAWKIGTIRSWAPPNGLGASTPSRQITGSLVEITDGTTTVTKGIVLTAYSDEDNRWWVAAVDVAYDSEG